MTIGERIKTCRNESNLTQKQLSELTGIAEITIRQYEAGKYAPKMMNLEKIAVALHISPAVLMGVTEDSALFKVVQHIPSATFESKDGKTDVNLFSTKELHNYFCLNSKGKAKALSYIEDLAKLPEYTDDEPPTTE